jgi:hypothetical protein
MDHLMIVFFSYQTKKGNKTNNDPQNNTHTQKQQQQNEQREPHKY